METFDFSILSLNVRGLRDSKKFVKLLNWFENHDGENGITFLQETHSSKEIEQNWIKKTKGLFKMSHGTTQSKGTAIIFGSKLDYCLKAEEIDENGRFIIILSEIQGSSFLLINSYLPNTEKEQVSLLKVIAEKIESIDCPIETHTIWGGDFNFIFDIDLEAFGGNASLKVNSISTIESINLENDLCDIWRIRNPNSKRYTWRGAGQGLKSKANKYIHRRLDYFFVSDDLQPVVNECEIIPAPSTDHSCLKLHLKALGEHQRGRSYWKINNSILENEAYIKELTNLLADYKINLDKNNIFNPQLRWELIKYEIRKFSIAYSKTLAKNRRNEYKDLENQINTIENIDRWNENEVLVAQHDQLKKLLENASNYITEGIILRSKSKWYELGEKVLNTS